jgi:hypothetical protein
MDSAQAARATVMWIPMEYLSGWVMAATSWLSEDAQLSLPRTSIALRTLTMEVASTTHARLARAKTHRICSNRLAELEPRMEPAQG